MDLSQEMKVVYVTALITSPSQQKSTERYLELGTWLFDIGVSVYVFVDASLESLARSWTVKWPHVKIAGVVQLKDLELMKFDHVELPRVRNQHKDTHEYLAIQNQKLGFLSDVAKLISDDDEISHLAWIDFGIAHVLQDRLKVAQFLREVGPSLKESKLWAPSAWPMHTNMSLDHVCWTFLGGFLVVPKTIVQDVWTRQKKIMRDLIPKISWEVNIWTYFKDVFETYPADHNDSMILGSQ